MSRLKRFDDFLNEESEGDNTYNYKLLGRLQSDCEYYLGHGTGARSRSGRAVWRSR
jgi:hypothetical protein